MQVVDPVLTAPSSSSSIATRSSFMISGTGRPLRTTTTGSPRMTLLAAVQRNSMNESDTMRSAMVPTASIAPVRD